MNKYIISADSGCDISKELCEKYNISVIPLHVVCADAEYLDGVNMQTKDVFDYALKTGKPPKTSAVSVGEFIDYFKGLLKENEIVVHFSLTGASSATYQNAALAAAELENVYTVDTRTFSAGSALAVIKGAELIEKYGIEEGVAKIKMLIEDFNGSMIMETLEFMKMGGRCSSLVSLGANLLGIKPSLDIIDGAFQLGKKYRGKYALAVKKYIADRLENVKVVDRRVAIALVSVTDEVRNAIKEVVDAADNVDEAIYLDTGCVISAHAGPNALGILFFEDKGREI